MKIKINSFRSRRWVEDPRGFPDTAPESATQIKIEIKICKFPEKKAKIKTTSAWIVVFVGNSSQCYSFFAVFVVFIQYD